MELGDKMKIAILTDTTEQPDLELQKIRQIIGWK